MICEHILSENSIYLLKDQVFNSQRICATIYSSISFTKVQFGKNSFFCQNHIRRTLDIFKLHVRRVF